MADDLPAYRTFLLGMPCSCEPCIAAVTIHHSTIGETFSPGKRPPKALGGKRGKGQRASDWFGISICHHHHGDFHGNTGYFAGWTNEQLDAWQTAHVARLQDLFDPDRADREAAELAAMQAENEAARLARDAAIAPCRDRLRKLATDLRGIAFPADLPCREVQIFVTEMEQEAHVFLIQMEKYL